MKWAPIVLLASQLAVAIELFFASRLSLAAATAAYSLCLPIGRG